MSSGTGERNRFRARERTDKKQPVTKCPVCGLRPALRYYNEIKRVWAYKHTKRMKEGGRLWTETTYHEADL